MAHQHPCWLALVALAGCTGAPPDEDPAAPDAGADVGAVAYLSPTDHLVRVAMMLGATRPSLDELRAVTDDPTALDGIVDAYLDAPRFGVVMRDLHAESLHLRVEQPNLTVSAIGPLQGRTFAEINASVFEEPLRLIERVITTDRPYTEIVTADYTMADAIVAGVWGLAHDPDGATWQPATYTDGRPAAGILSSSALYLRHRSAGANYHRGRANLVSRTLLCHDYLDSDIAIDTSIDLSDPDVVSDAVRTNPACIGCHQTLDPLGSFLFGFRNQINVNQIDAYPLPIYTPGTEQRWQNTTRRPPGFFGVPGERLDDLGRLIADDPRFARCAVTRFASYFLQTEPSALSPWWIAELTDAFVASGHDAKALARAIVLSDAARVSHAVGDHAGDDVIGMLRTRPEQLDLMLFDLTGFRWTTDSTRVIRNMPAGRTNLLRSDFLGFRVLAGGIDAYFVTSPVHTTNAASSLVQRTFARHAADEVVTRDLAAAPADRRLLTRVGPDDTDPPLIRDQLADLHLRLYGSVDAPDGPAVDETYAVFADTLARTGDPVRAWKTTLTAMLSDLRIAYH